ncbi:MAG: hypothetical protein O3B87_01625 [bacterium]|nr:hypothetical protein [bacterium]
MPIKRYSSHFHKLRDAWVARHKKIHKDLVGKHRESLIWIKANSKQLIAGSAAGMLMLSHPVSAQTLAQNLIPSTAPVDKTSSHSTSSLVEELKAALPPEVTELNAEQEAQIAAIFKSYFGMNAQAQLYGKRLNRSYGLIGAEQHLARYSGDTMETHFQTAEESQYASSGMAPGRGAWGWFAQSSALNQEDIEREKYYLAVQTFLAPGWDENPNELYAFFKYRKMLIVNPENGKAMVVVIGDAGPAPWTGKHLGGSPEVMSYLERQDGSARGPVVYFFIDDPENTVPLGPINIH